jgi:hypothetical protein
VLLCLGLACLGVLAFAARRLIALDKAVDAGDATVLSIFAIFGLFCVVLGWRLRPARAESVVPAASQGPVAPKALPRRVTVSQACAAAGVLLVVLSVLVPAYWYPVVLFFAGLALLAISHGLTPCVERIEQLRNARDSMRQL